MKIDIKKQLKRATLAVSIILFMAMLLILFLVDIVNASMPGEDSGAYIVRKTMSGHISRGRKIAVKVKDDNGEETVILLRVIAKAGETVSIKGGYVYVDDQPAKEKDNVRSSFIVSKDASFKITHAMERVCGKVETGDTIALPVTKIKPEWKRYLRVPVLKNMPDSRIYPYERFMHWNAYNMGPIMIPKKRETIELNEKNKALYRPITGTKDNGEERYTFEEDYVWAMCDNRDICNDSRRYGPIATSDIVGIVEMKIW